MATPDVKAVEQEAMRDAFRRLVRFRVAVAPLFAAVQAVAVWADPVPWRAALGGTLFTVLAVVSGVEYERMRRGWTGDRALPANVLAMTSVQLGVVALTGGIHSPLLAVVPATSVQFAVVLGRSPAQRVAVALQVAAVWLFAGLEASGVSLVIPALGPRTGTPIGPWVVAAALTLILLGISALGLGIRGMVEDLIGRTLSAAERERQAHAEHARDLVTLSSEIAHELKNPLASVKGLGALLGKDLEGKAAERLAVLRAEVDRMQETLDEFLDFSRPLVPLTQVDVSPSELFSEVSALCEGQALARGVRLVSRAGPDVVHGDRRKLRQLLVNLVQNALEASPPGGTVELVSEGGALEVRDRGPGPPEGVDVFAPGATTKDTGSGLGLTIARALVTQHGGELTLTRREGGGAIARVRW